MIPNPEEIDLGDLDDDDDEQEDNPSQHAQQKPQQTQQEEDGSREGVFVAHAGGEGQGGTGPDDGATRVGSAAVQESSGPAVPAAAAVSLLEDPMFQPMGL